MLVHDRNAGLARIRPTLLVVLSARRRPTVPTTVISGCAALTASKICWKRFLNTSSIRSSLPMPRYSRLNGSIWPIAARLAAHLLVAESALQKSMRPSTSSM